MTLRGRLTTAFLAVVLGPVLLGAFFVAGTLATISRAQSEDRLTLAAATVRSSISALCQQLHATAGAVAVLADPVSRAGAASEVVTRGLAGAVLITDLGGAAEFVTPGAPDRPWVSCAGPAATGPGLRALGARVELRNRLGVVVGAVWVGQALDVAFVRRLASASGTGVTLVDEPSAPGTAVPPRPDPSPGPGEAPSTEPTSVRAGVLAAARRISGDRIVRTGDGRYVRRVDPAQGQPLPLVLSVRRNPPAARYGSLGVGVLLAGALAALAAWRLARSTTRPLAELARAADRVADGDLAARVPVRAPDEVGRLADSFNRMTRDSQSYLRALVISRQQLRDQLSVLGDTLASTHDLHRIFQVILRSAMAATGARAGVVLLLDPGTGMLVSQCAEGLEGRAVRLAHPIAPDRAGPAALRVPLGAGLLGTVAATREPRRGRLDRDGPPLYAYEPRCRTYVAVPFSAPAPGGVIPLPASGGGNPSLSLRSATDGWPESGTGSGPGSPATSMAWGGAGGFDGGPPALGVLALYDRLGSDEFDDADLITLGSFAGHAAVAVDNVRVHEEAQRLSLTDPLTGLWNYRYLEESIRREIERASRFGRMLSALALDLDRFKEVNDTYGHAAGDAVLAEFARRIRGAMREVDLAFRQGGEEFVVLLPETDARGAVTVAERLGAAVRETPIAIRPRPGVITPVRGLVSVTVSVGVAVYPDHAGTGPQLLAAADEALYAAKAAGRDTYQLAVASGRPVSQEIPVRVGAASPADGLPRAGGRSERGAGGGRGRPVGRPGERSGSDPEGGADGALSGPQPPRQVRGR